MPAAFTRTSSSPASGRGSGCSRTAIAPSSMVAARISAMLPGRGGWRTSAGFRVKACHGRLARPDPRGPTHPAVVAGIPHRPRSGGAAAQPGVPRRRRAGGRRPAGAADPGLHGRRRLARDDDPLAARQRLPHAAGRDPHERRLLGGGVRAAGEAARGLRRARPGSR